MGNGDVTSPPYDTLTDDEIIKLRKNPYNILNLSGCGDEDECRNLIKKWLDTGILKNFDMPSLVILRQRYSNAGSFFERLGVIGTVDVGDPENRLLEHENVIPEYVKQRKDHITRLGAQTEPVFTVVDSTGLHSILSEIMERKGCVKSYEEPRGTWNDICIVHEEEYINRIFGDLVDRTAIIADGHHRYMAMKEIFHETSGYWNRMLVYVTSIESDATRIGEVHRIFDIWDGVDADLSRYYDFEKFDGEGRVPAPSFLTREKAIVLKKNKANSRQEDVYLIEEFLNSGRSKKNNLGMEYTSSLDKVTEEIEKDEHKGAIIMPVWNKKKFYELVKDGKLLPAKSTYFYPKIPSGIAFYTMEKLQCHCSSGGRAADS